MEGRQKYIVSLAIHFVNEICLGITRGIMKFGKNYLTTRWNQLIVSSNLEDHLLVDGESKAAVTLYAKAGWIQFNGCRILHHANKTLQKMTKKGCNGAEVM